jgi:hypothetical protein
MASFGSMPSLATATSSRLDSSCKHIQQCRVSQDHMTQFVGGEADELVRNKYRYCVHKDEMVLGIGRPLSQSKDVKRFQNSAYPRVVSNLGKLLQRSDPNSPTEAERILKVLYHCARSLGERKELLLTLQTGDTSKLNPALVGNPSAFLPMNAAVLTSKDLMPTLYDMTYVGFANTLGWAHAHNGDTMSSVMIGGLRTVRNGAFEVQTGDLLQWYWPFEQDCFRSDGQRKPVPTFIYVPTGNAVTDILVDPGTHDPTSGVMVARDAQLRKDFRDQQYGNRRGEDKAVPLVKPYLPFDDETRIYDWYRVIGRALAPARPFEELDMQISRQAL